MDWKNMCAVAEIVGENEKKIIDKFEI